MNENLEAEKQIIEAHHAKGYKCLSIGVPLAGKDVPKLTFSSFLNMYNPLSMIDLLVKNKIMSMVKIVSTFPMDANRNEFAKNAIEAGVDYLLWLDMDQTFPADAITNLFEVISDERPIVGGMYYLKKEPYAPVLGRYVDWEESSLPHKEYYEQKGYVHSDGRPLMSWRPITFFDKTNPFQVDVIGLGCVLMKTSVFKDLTYPYFSYTQDPRPGQEYRQMDEVMPFCAQLKKLNIPIWIDPRVQCGHLTTLETNADLFQACRDAQFATCAKEDPAQFDKISKLFIDVREEQKNGTRFEQVTVK